jgi:hypothetical protein
VSPKPPVHSGSAGSRERGNGVSARLLTPGKLPGDKKVLNREREYVRTCAMRELRRGPPPGGHLLRRVRNAATGSNIVCLGRRGATRLVSRNCASRSTRGARLPGHDAAGAVHPERLARGFHRPDGGGSAGLHSGDLGLCASRRKRNRGLYGTGELDHFGGLLPAAHGRQRPRPTTRRRRHLVCPTEGIVSLPW